MTNALMLAPGWLRPRVSGYFRADVLERGSLVVSRKVSLEFVIEADHQA
jgi:hypothetical protein